MIKTLLATTLLAAIFSMQVEQNQGCLILWIFNFTGRADGYENQEVVDLSMQGFVTCNTDGQYGLTWDEIEACEARFCNALIYECPTEDNFHEMDANNDENLTIDEYLDFVRNQ